MKKILNEIYCEIYPIHEMYFLLKFLKNRIYFDKGGRNNKEDSELDNKG